jgi:hypothetical protein
MEFNAFDLVELTESVADHQAGDRGTVMLAGPDHVRVDFAWRDHHEPTEHDAVDVGNHSLRLIERRRDQQAPGATDSALEAAGLSENAMSLENVEVVRNAFDAFNAFMRGEHSENALAGLAAPEFEYDWPAEREVPEPDHLRGVPEAFELIERIQSAWVDFVWEPLDFIEAPGNRVLVAVRQSGRGRESGLPDESHHFQLFTIRRDGRVRKVDFFGHRTEALEAAGLSE